MQPKDTSGERLQSVRDLLDARASDARVHHVAAVVAGHMRALGWTDVAEGLDGAARELARLDGGTDALNERYRPLIEAWCRRDGAHTVLREVTEQAAFGYRWTVADEQEWAEVVERLLELVQRADAHALPARR